MSVIAFMLSCITRHGEIKEKLQQVQKIEQVVKADG